MRGHYPLETDSIRQELESASGLPVDAEILCPYFREGGRVTINNVHYVARHGRACARLGNRIRQRQDLRICTFRSAGLYRRENEGRGPRAGDVQSISIEQLRARWISMGSRICSARCTATRNWSSTAADEYDVKVFCVALYRALQRGKRFCCRTAASFVKAVAAIPDRPLLTREEMITEETDFGGIVVVGSHTAKTTMQLTELLTLPQTEPLALNSDLVLKKGCTGTGNHTRDPYVQLPDPGREKRPWYSPAEVYYPCRETPKIRALERSVRISNARPGRSGGAFCQARVHHRQGRHHIQRYRHQGVTSTQGGCAGADRGRAFPCGKPGRKAASPGIPYVIFPGKCGPGRPRCVKSRKYCCHKRNNRRIRL